MTIYSIYKATNLVNGKSYTGFTNNFSRRKANHLQESKKGKSHFNNAIRKYGKENFQWEIICQSKDGHYLLDQIEPHFIREYDTFKNGYNRSIGGENPSKGVIFTVERRKQISDRTKGSLNPFYGKKHTPDVLDKMRESSTGKVPSKENLQKRSISVSKAKRQSWIATELSTGNEYFTDNLKQFCLNRDLPYHRLVQVASGKTTRKQTRGWKLRKYVGNSEGNNPNLPEYRDPTCVQSA